MASRARTPAGFLQEAVQRGKRLWKSVASIAVIVVGLVGLAKFPDEVKKATDITLATIQRLQPPMLTIWYEWDWNRNRAAKNLLTELYPAANDCVIDSQMADLTQRGWASDMLVEFAANPSNKEDVCGSNVPGTQIASVAIFAGKGLGFQPAGRHLGSSGELPASWSAAGRFIFQSFYGVDSPWITVWYVDDKHLAGGDVQLKITDESEHDYTPQTRQVGNLLIIWGIPEGLSYLEVSSTGELLKHKGVPPSASPKDDDAIELTWNGLSFVDADGNDIRPDAIAKGQITVGPHDHLYVSGCELMQGFVQSTSFPGAVSPISKEQPILRCGGTNEDDYSDIRVIVE